jgi:hypothetical protein
MQWHDVAAHPVPTDPRPSAGPEHWDLWPLIPTWLSVTVKTGSGLRSVVTATLLLPLAERRGRRSTEEGPG